jgi:hypothetical protein
MRLILKPAAEEKRITGASSSRHPERVTRPLARPLQQNLGKVATRCWHSPVMIDHDRGIRYPHFIRNESKTVYLDELTKAHARS